KVAEYASKRQMTPWSIHGDRRREIGNLVALPRAESRVGGASKCRGAGGVGPKGLRIFGRDRDLEAIAGSVQVADHRDAERPGRDRPIEIERFGFSRYIAKYWIVLA